MSSYLGPIRRFAWLFLIAVPVALVAGMLVLYEVSPTGPGPTFGKRNKPTYEASVQILVNSPASPYLRAHTARDSAQGQALLDAANYLPFIIQSDRVAAIRTKKIGPVPGIVTGQALFARETNRGLNESPIPIIEVSGFSGTPANAVRLARGTVDALMTWLAAEQEKARIGLGGRVLLQPLRSPTVTVDQPSSNGLALLVSLVVLLGFVALAWMLDRVFPRAGSTAVGADGRAVMLGRDPPLEPAPLLHNSTVVSVDGEPAPLLHNSNAGGNDGGPAGDHAPESTPVRSTEEPEARPASQRRWA